VICGQLAPDGFTVQVVAPQPADVSACALVLVSGPEAGMFQGIAFPTNTDAATAWVWGFSLVVVSYMFAWAVGAVVNFINGK